MTAKIGSKNKRIFILILQDEEVIDNEDVTGKFVKLKDVKQYAFERLVELEMGGV